MIKSHDDIMSYAGDVFSFVNSMLAADGMVCDNSEYAYHTRNEIVHAAEYVNGNIEEIKDFVDTFLPKPYQSVFTCEDEEGSHSEMRISAKADDKEFHVTTLRPGDVLVHLGGRSFTGIAPDVFHKLFVNCKESR